MRSRTIEQVRIVLIALIFAFTISLAQPAYSRPVQTALESRVAQLQMEKRSEALAQRRTKLHSVLNSAKKAHSIAQAVTLTDEKRAKPRLYKTKDEFVRFLSAPQYGHFEVPHAKGYEAERVAEIFLDDNRDILTERHADLGFKYLRKYQRGQRSFIRFQQTFAGLEVIGGETVVQVDEATNGIATLNNSLMRSVTKLDEKPDALIPVIQAQGAGHLAKEWMQKKYPKLKLKAFTPELKIFDPTIFQMVGDPQLVWFMEVWEQKNRSVGEAVIIEASLGEIVFHYSLVNQAFACEIGDIGAVNPQPGSYDNNNGTPFPEPDTASPADVYLAYQYLQDAYNFFNQERFGYWKGYDGIDSLMQVDVRDISKITGDKPPAAVWTGDKIVCGPGTVTDDTIGHEFTHGVVDATCDLTYSGESGAIDEAFADMFGEWIDQSNGKSRDASGTEPNRYDPPVDINNYDPDTINDDINSSSESGPNWELFEDDQSILPDPNRSMKAPDNYDQPDTYPGDPTLAVGNWQSINDPNDNGGVHTNNGVGNKLAYLLSSTGTHHHNGIDVVGLGIEKASSLFFESMHLLTSTL